MSHLNTATFDTDEGAINVPTSGFDSPPDALKQLLARGWTPIPFPSRDAAVQAAQQTSNAWSHGPEDIYPLGQGHGLGADIINFALNNLYQYGQRTKASNENMAQVMSNISQGKPAGDLGPLIQDAISVNPIMAGTWGPIRTAAQKKAVSALWRADPEAVKAIATDPRELNLSGLMDIPNRDVMKKVQSDLLGEGFMPAGATATYTPSKDVIKVAPATMRGKAFVPGDPPRFMGLVPSRPEYYSAGQTNLPEIMGHEAQHFLNVPRVYQSDIPNEAATRMYGQLRPYLSEHAQKSALEGGIKSVDPKVALDEALSYLSMPGERKGAADVLHNLIKMRPGPEAGTTSGVKLTPEVLQSAIAKAEALGQTKPDQSMIARIWDKMMGRTPQGTREAIFRHGTDPESAAGIIKEGLRPGSSVSRVGGRDFEGYPVTFEFDDKLTGATPYSSPLGPTMHEGAARTGTQASNIKRIFFDPNEYQFKEDALDVFRNLRQRLNESGRKDLKIEAANYHDPTGTWNYGGTPSLKDLPRFTDYVAKQNDNNLQRLFNETLDNATFTQNPARQTIHEKRLDHIIAEMEKRGMGGGGPTERSATFNKFGSETPGGQLIDEYYKRYSNERMQDIQGMLDKAKQMGRPDVEQRAIEQLQPPPKDEFIRDMVEWIGRGLDYPNSYAPGARGLAGIRRTMLGKDVPFDPNWANKPMNQLDSTPIPSSDLVSILHHLDKYGLLTPENLARRTGLGGEVRGTPGELNPFQVNKLRRFIEESNYQPKKGK